MSDSQVVHIFIVGAVDGPPQPETSPPGRRSDLRVRFSLKLPKLPVGGRGEPEIMPVVVVGKAAHKAAEELRPGQVVLVTGRLSPARPPALPELTADYWEPVDIHPPAPLATGLMGGLYYLGGDDE